MQSLQATLSQITALMESWPVCQRILWFGGFLVWGGGCLLVLFGVFLFVCFCFAVLGCFLLVVWFGFVFGGFCVCVGYYLFGFSFKFHYTSCTCHNEHEPWRYEVLSLVFQGQM